MHFAFVLIHQTEFIMPSVLPNASQPPGRERPLLTANDAAAYLTISPRTLWSLTKNGQIHCIRIGRSVRYAIDDLDEFISARKGVNDVEA